MVKENKYHSYNIGKLSEGCRKCIKGEKLVLFITGECPRRCYFCPVSDQKYQKDVIFANERKVENFSDVLKEAEAMDARGAGITGGDPLAKARLHARIDDRVIDHGPTYIFEVSVDLTKEKIFNIWEANPHKDKDESQKLVAIPNNVEAINRFIRKHYRGVVENRLREDNERCLLHPGALALASYSGIPLNELAKSYKD